jgi:DnaD/phage-associated family protein
VYTKVESTFWTDEKVIELSATARYLMLYILTSPHRNILGLFFLPEPYMCFDSGLSPEQFKQGFQELLDKGLIKYDAKTKIILVKNFLKYNPIENPNQTKSAIEKLNELPQTELLKDFTEVISYLSQEKEFLKPLLERLKERLGKGLPQPVSSISNQYTVSSINNADDDNVDAPEEKPGQTVESVESSTGTKAMEFAEKAWGRPVAPLDCENISQWCADFSLRGSPEPDEIVIEALRRSSEQGVRKMSYVDSILRDWYDNGVLLVSQISELDEKFEQAKNQKSHKRRTTDPPKPGKYDVLNF